MWTVKELADGTPDPASVWAWSFGKHLPIGKLSAIGGLSTVVLALYVLSFVFCGSANKILARISSDMVRDLRRDIDEKMHRMKLNYYDTHANGEILSKGAENVSQGQRQLLTIARAIVANPEIMILDEATSNVDAHTEQVIQNAMATLMKGRTSFVIAHRLSTIRDANVILYMENGDIKEVGDHDALMARGGKYAELYNSQFTVPSK